MGRMTKDYDGEFPYAKPEGSDASMFIQWKNTKLCMDFRCQCGEYSHGDGDFAYNVECGACGAIYEMGLQVIAKRIPEATGATLLLAPHDETKWKTDWPSEPGSVTVTLNVSPPEGQESPA
jgi:hypothetical protein